MAAVSAVPERTWIGVPSLRRPNPPDVRGLMVTLVTAALVLSISVVVPAVFDRPVEDVVAGDAPAAASQFVAAGDVPDGLTLEEWSSIQRQIAAAEAIRIEPAAVTPSAQRALPTPTLASATTSARFSAAGALVATRSATSDVRFTTNSIGDVVAGGVLAEQAGSVVTYRHTPGVSEWYRTVGAGLQHGFTIDAPVSTNPRLEVEVEVSGGIPESTGPTAARIIRDGALPLSYSGLIAWDADGVDLPASMTVSDQSILLHVDTRGATYPIMIDPIITEDTKLLPLDAAADENFGRAVDIDGDRLAVGAPNDDTGSADSGAVYLYVRDDATSDWQLDAVVANPTPAEVDRFGDAVAMFGDRVAIGQSDRLGDQADAGEVVVFERVGPGTWTQVGSTITVGVFGYDAFGASIAIQDVDTLVVGAPASNGEGAVYQVRWNGVDDWNEPVDAGSTVPLADGDELGYSVAVAREVSGDAVIVAGSPGFDRDNGNDPDTGRLQIYRDSGAGAEPVQSVEIGAVWEPGDRVGTAVAAADGGLLAVAGLAEQGAGATLQAYLLEPVGQNFAISDSVAATLDADVDGDPNHYLDLIGRNLFLARPGDGGSVAVFRDVDGAGLPGEPVDTLEPTEREPGDAVGFALAVDDRTLVAGAPRDDDVDDDAGAVYSQREQPLTHHFVGPGIGWGTASNWDTGLVPGPNDTAIIPPGGVEVGVGGAQAVGNLIVGSDSSLRIELPSDSLTLTGGLDDLVSVNRGRLLVGGALSVDVGLANSGTIEFDQATAAGIDGAGTLTNAGGTIATTGTGSVTISTPLVSEDGSTIDHQVGTLIIDGTFDNAGVLQLAGGALLNTTGASTLTPTSRLIVSITGPSSGGAANYGLWDVLGGGTLDLGGDISRAGAYAVTAVDSYPVIRFCDCPGDSFDTRTLFPLEATVGASDVTIALSPCDVAWTNGTGNDLWSDGGNWTGGVPGPLDVVCLDVPAVDTVIVDGVQEVARIHVAQESLSITGTLTVNEPSVIDGGLFVNGTLVANGEIVAANGGSVDGTVRGDLAIAPATTFFVGNATIEAARVTNDGTVNVTADTVVTAESNIVNNGTWNFVQAGAQALVEASDGSTFTNNAVITKRGVGTLTLPFNVTVNMGPGSAIDVQEGAVDFDSSGTWTGAPSEIAIIVADDAVFDFGGDQNLDGTLDGVFGAPSPGSVVMSGTKTSTGSVRLNFAEDPLTPGSPDDYMLDLNGVTLAGDTFALDGFARVGGDVDASASFQILPSGTMAHSAGTFRLDGSMQNDGVFDAVTGGGVLTGSGSWTNSGIFRTSDGTGDTYDIDVAQWTGTAGSELIVFTSSPLLTNVPTHFEDGLVSVLSDASLTFLQASSFGPNSIVNVSIVGPSSSTANFGRIDFGLVAPPSGLGASTLVASRVGYSPIDTDSYTIGDCGPSDCPLFGATDVSPLEQTLEGGDITLALPAAAQASPVVAIDGDWAVVGVPAQGDVFVLRNVAGVWTDAQTISLGTAGFGSSVALADPYLVIGSPDAGQVDIFERPPGSGTFAASFSQSGDVGYGSSLDVSDDGHLVVGSPDGTGGSAGSGIAFVYDLVAGGFVFNTIVGAPGDRVGESVAVEGGSVYVGAPGTDLGANDDAGVVYRYDLTGTPLQTLQGGAGSPGREYGMEIAATADRVAVGSATALTVDVSPVVGSTFVVVGGSSGFGNEIAIAGDLLVVNDGGSIRAEVFADNGNDKIYTSVGIQPGSYTDVDAGGGSVAFAFEPSGTATSGLDAVTLVDSPILAPSDKVLPAVGAAGDEFGLSVAIDDDTMIVGAPQADFAGRNDGALYVFERVGGVWVETQRLDDQSGLGTAIAVDGDTLVAGIDGGFAVYQRSAFGNPFTPTSPATVAMVTPPRTARIDGASLVLGVPNANGSEGEVQVYDGGPDGWTATAPQVITANGDKVGTDRFGTDADLSGNVLIVGAPMSASFVAPPAASGYAEIWIRPDAVSPFVYASTLEADIFDDFYGWSVAIDGDVVAAAAPRLGTGLVDVFDVAGAPVLLGGLTDGSNNSFGYSIDIDAGVLAVGDFSDTVSTYDVTGPSPTLISAEVHSDFEPGDNTAGTNAIRTSAGTIVSGARLEDQQGTDAGAVYTFTVAVPDPLPPDVVGAEPPSAGADFGSSIVQYDDLLVVGAPGEAGSGAVYVFRRVLDGPWTFSQRLDAGADVQVGAEFGFDVDVLETTAARRIIIGAPGEDVGVDADAGAVYHVVESGTTFESLSRLDAGADVQAGARFGHAVGYSSNGRMAIGAPFEDVGGTIDAGRMYAAIVAGAPPAIEFQATYDPPATTSSTEFGFSISAHQKDLIVGAPGGTGEVYRYFAAGTSYSLSSETLTGGAGVRFGAAVDTWDNVIAVGAPDTAVGGTDSGVVHVYELVNGALLGSYAEVAVLDAGPLVPAADLGASVAVRDAVVTAGAAGSGVAGQAFDWRRVDNVWQNATTIAATVPTADGEFGRDVWIDDETILVGQPGLTVGAVPGIGGVQQVATVQNAFDRRLLPSDGAAGDQLGRFVDTDGPTIVAGTRFHSHDGLTRETGSAYVWERQLDGGYLEVAELLADAPTEFDRFGYSVAVDGDVILVGAPYTDRTETNEGSVYVFGNVGGTWTQLAELNAAAPSNAGLFGWSVHVEQVSLDRWVAVVGSVESAATGDGGAAFVYLLEPFVAVPTYVEAARIDTDHPDITLDLGDRFGADVAADGVGRIIVGAPSDDDVDTDVGAAYVFETADTEAPLTYTLVDKVLSPAPFAGTSYDFGHAVDIDGTAIAVGSPQEDQLNSNFAGAGYIFEDVGGAYVEQIRVATTFGTSGGNSWGSNVALEGDAAVVSVGGQDVYGLTGRAVWRVDGVWTAGDDIRYPEPLHLGSTGSGLALAPDGTVAVGAPVDNTSNGYSSGSVYALHISEPPAKIVDQSAGAEPGDLFGFDVAVSGDVLVVGAVEEIGFAGTTGDAGNGGRGEIHVFDRVGGEWVYDRTIDGPLGGTGNINDGFGYSVDISGDWIIVGAPRANGPGDTTGRVHFIDTANGDAIQTVAPPSPPDINVSFGLRVAIDGTTAAVGAPNWGATSGGQVVVYELIGGVWTVVQQYSASGGYRLGRGIDLDGDRLAFGTQTNSGAGFVVVADRVGGEWPTQTDPFNTSDPQPDFDMFFNLDSGSQFGTEVALDGDHLLIGAPNGSGTGFVEHHTVAGASWELVQTITPDTSIEYRSFGYALDLDGRRAVVGARRSDTAAGSEAGAAFVFHEFDGTFAQVAEHEAIDGAPGDNYGFDVELDGDGMLVGSPGDDNTNGLDAGAVYTVDLAAPPADRRIFVADGEADDLFGQSVDIHENWMVVGARYGGGAVADSGSAYVFRRDFDGDEWTLFTELTASDASALRSFGQGVAIAGTIEEFDGDRGNFAIAVGAPALDDVTQDGQVYLYRYDPILDDWVETDVVTAPAGASGFGYSVDIEQRTSAFRNGGYAVVVGAIAGGPGSAHLYRYVVTENPSLSSTVTPLGELVPPNSTTGDLFGISVAIDGDTILVGQRNGVVTGAGNAGAAHVFTYTNSPGSIDYEATLVQPTADALDGDGMGHAVDIDGDLAVVTAFFDRTGGVAAGAAYVYERVDSTWSEGTELVSDASGAGDNFGAGAAVQDGAVAVSSFSGGLGGAGSIEVFTEDSSDGWVALEYEWESGGPNTGAGISLALSEDGVLVVGAAEADTFFGDDAGAVQVFDAFVPQPPNKVIPGTGPRTADLEQFGQQIDVDGEWAIVMSDSDVAIYRDVAGSWTEFQNLSAPGAPRRVAIGGDWAAVHSSSTMNVYRFDGGAWVLDAPVATIGSYGAIDIDGVAQRLIAAETVLGTRGAIVLDLPSGTIESVAVTGATTGGLGSAVAIDGDVAFAAAPVSDEVVVFGRTGGSWAETSRIAAPGSTGQRFGFDIAAANGRLVVGQPVGARAWIFEASGGVWSDTALLVPGQTNAGWSVDIDGDLAAVGGPREQVDGVWSGGATLYARAGTSWIATEVIEAVDREFGDALGKQVALSGTRMLVSAPLDTNPGGVQAGATYFFDIVQPDAPSLSFDLDLSSGPVVQLAPGGLAVTDFDATVLEDAADDGSTVAASPLSAIDVQDSPLSAIDIGDTPLSAIVLDSTPLSAIPLINIDIDGGWDQIVALSPRLRDIPINDLTFGDVLADGATAGEIASTSLSAIDVDGTPLSAIPLSAIALGTIPLSAIPLSAIGQDWCAIVAPYLTDVTCATGADLTDLNLLEATLRGVPLSAIPLSAIPLSAIDFDDPSVQASPLSAIGLDEINLNASPLSAIPLSAIPLSAIGPSSTPLSAIPLSAIGLDATPLSAIPLSAIDVAGTPLSSIPLSAIGVGSTPLSAIPVSIPLSAIPLSAIDVDGSPLSAIQVTGVPLSAIPLSAIVLADSPLSAIPLSAIGPTNDAAWCELLADVGGGFDCTTTADVTTTTLRKLSVRGVPLSAIPLSAIPLSAIDLEGAPLSAIPLSAIPLSAIPLSAIPLSAIDLQGTPLSAIDPTASPLSPIPLSAIPLSAIDLQGSPLSAIPLSAIDLQGSPLSAIPLSAIPLSAIPMIGLDLAAVSVGGTSLSAIPLDAIDLVGSPLSTIPLSDVEPTAIDCTLVDCDAQTLGDASTAGAIVTGSTLSAIQDGSAGISLGELAGAATGFGAADLSTALGSAGLDVGDLTDLAGMLLGDLPSVDTVDQITLGDLAEALYTVRYDDLVGALIDPGTGLPFTEADAQSALRAAVDAFTDPAGQPATLGDVESLGDVTLGEILEGGPTLTLADLGPMLGFITVQAVLDYLGATTGIPTGTLADLDELELGQLTLADLFGEGISEFDSLVLGDLLSEIEAELEGLTLGDLLLVLLGASSMNFGGADFETINVADLPESTLPDVTFAANFTPSSPQARSYPIELEVTMPGTASYVPGTTTVTVTDGGLPPVDVAVEPDVDGSRLTWTFADVGSEVNYDVSFDVKPTITLGATALSATARLVGTDVVVPAGASVRVAEGLEPNDFPPPEVTPVADDTIYLTYISDATDIDVFEIVLQDDDRLALELSNLSADFDVALYRDGSDTPVGTPLAGTNGNDPIVPITDPDADGASSEPLNDFPRLDAVDPDLQLIDVSNARGTDNEVIVTGGLSAGTYYIQVYGANGASSTQPAALQVQIDEAENRPECQAVGALPSATPGDAFSVTDIGDANTLFLVNEMRLEQFHGAADRQAVMDELTELTAYLEANPALGVDPAVVAVDGLAGVRALYDIWDGLGDPEAACDPEAANAIVAEINAAIIDPVREQLDHIVIIGGDEAIPMARLHDATSIANEYDYRHEFDGDLPGTGAAVDGANAFSSVFWESRFLSDEPYGESAAQSLGDRYLYVSDIALGRLVESPSEIVRALDDFVVHQGSLDIDTGTVLGYDFLADGSTEIADELIATGITVDDQLAVGDFVDPTSGETRAWERADAESAIQSAGQNALISLNAHFDHYRALPAAGDQVIGFDDNLIATDVSTLLGPTGLNQSVVFSMGCHSGLAVPDALIARTNTDWAAEIAGSGGVYVANTGFGYGDTETVAYTEELMALFAEYVSVPFDVDGASTTVGEALMFAKNEYVADLAVMSVYDEKALMESTFYGLPFYRTALPTAELPPVPVNVPTPDPQGGDTVPFTVDPENVPVSTDRGDYYTNPDDDGDDQIIVAPGRPIQPADTIDVSVVDPATPDELADIAHGVMVIDMTSTWVLLDDPVISTPIFDESDSQLEPEVGDQTFPAKPATLTTSTTPSGERQTVVLATGQYRSETTAQRLDEDIDVVVYYSPETETDFTEPTIGAVTSTLDEGLLTVTATVTDDNTVDRVYVLVAENPGLGTVDWIGLDLTNSGGSQWAGSRQLAPTTTDVEFLVQAKDAAGNVGYATNKAENFNDDATPSQPSPPTPDLDVEVDDTNLDVDSGWYTADVAVTVDSGVLGATFSVDGAPPVPVVGTGFTISGDGIHTWTVTTDNNQTRSGTVRIDSGGPPTVLLGTPVVAGTYEIGTSRIDLVCADTSLVSCDLTINGVAVDVGDDLPSTPGLYVLGVVAVDALGNETDLEVPFEMVAAPNAIPQIGTINAPSVPQPVGDGVFIDIEFDDADGSTDDYTVTIDWGDDADGTRPSTVCIATSDTPQTGNPSCEIVVEPGSGPGIAVGQFVYDAPGVYAVTVTVADAAGNVDTAVFEFVVVYDAGAGRVSGSGWYWSGNEAYDDGDPWGNWAHFGYRARYRNDEPTPRGTTKLHLWGEFFFTSTAYDYLVINDTVAVAEGSGRLDGQDGYRFRVQGIDNGWVDFFQITIWNEATGEIVYDNGVMYDEGDFVLLGGIRIRS